jgi:hypothetical protein
MDKWEGFWVVVLSQIIFYAFPLLLSLMGSGFFWKAAAAAVSLAAIFYVGSDYTTWVLWTAGMGCACVAIVRRAHLRKISGEAK